MNRYSFNKAPHFAFTGNRQAVSHRFLEPLISHFCTFFFYPCRSTQSRSPFNIRELHAPSFACRIPGVKIKPDPISLGISSGQQIAATVVWETDQHNIFNIPFLYTRYSEKTFIIVLTKMCKNITHNTPGWRMPVLDKRFLETHASSRRKIFLLISLLFCTNYFCLVYSASGWHMPVMD